MHIQRVEITNVRRFGPNKEQHLALDLPDRGWIVLAGPNGSGKTTVLQCIAKTLLRETPEDPFRSMVGWFRSGSKRTSIRLTLAPSKDDQWAREVEDRSSKQSGDPLELEDYWEPFHSALRHGRKSDSDRAFNGPWSVSARGWLVAGYGAHRRAMGHSDEALRWMQDDQRGAGTVTLFRRDASLMHPIRWLMDLHHRSVDDTSSDSDRKTSKATVSVVLQLLNDGLLPSGVEVERVTSRGLTVKVGGESHELLDLGAGVQGTIALVVDVLRQMHLCFGAIAVDGSAARVSNSGVVLVDEPELHLHVSWQKRLGFWLKEHFPNVQFIVATHSPFVCQAADPGGLVRLFAQDSTRSAAVADATLYRTVVNGAVDESVLSDLFGLEHSYSDASQKLREELAALDAKVLQGKKLTAKQVERAAELRKLLPATGTEKIEQLFRSASGLR